MNNYGTTDRQKPAEWESYAAELMFEFAQLTDEGFDTESYRELFASCAKLPAGKIKDQFGNAIYELSKTMEMRADYKYNEPSDYDSILALSAGAQDITLNMPSADTLKDKIEGGWYGRICGCLLGKPVEGYWEEELLPFLQKSGNYPMHRYLMRSTDDAILKELDMKLSACLADEIDAAPSDDDTNYTVISQRLIEKYGRDFTPSDIAQLWMSSLPKTAYCTAERVAFINFCNGYTPPYSAIYKNPYREFIGAQIRGDYFGFINPCNPQAAAEMAWRDASISHTKNGIYGEMFVAGMIAAAFGTDSIPAIIDAGLSVIPSTSRLYDEISKVKKMHADGMSTEQMLQYIHEQYDEKTQYHWCHTISNAMIVAIILLSENGDYGKSICMAVQTGFDTDCNGATIGSILGVRNGIAGVPACWTQPIHKKLRVSICGEDALEIDKLVNTTLTHIAIK